jgi:hypothetical protein
MDKVLWRNVIGCQSTNCFHKCKKICFLSRMTIPGAVHFHLQKFWSATKWLCQNENVYWGKKQNKNVSYRSSKFSIINVCLSKLWSSKKEKTFHNVESMIILLSVHFLMLHTLGKKAAAICLLTLFPTAGGLKGTVSRDFRPSVFFIKQSPLGPWFTA